MQILERSQSAEIEDRPQIDAEALATLAGKAPLAAGQVVNGRIRQMRVVGRRAWPNIVGRTRQVVSEDERLARPGRYFRDLVELAAVPGWIVQGADRAGVVQEGVRVPNFVGELE